MKSAARSTANLLQRIMFVFLFCFKHTKRLACEGEFLHRWSMWVVVGVSLWRVSEFGGGIVLFEGVVGVYVLSC